MQADCAGVKTSLPPYVVIAEGQSYRKAFGEQVIRRGQEVVLKHTFSFTSAEPGSINLSAVGQRTIFEDSDSPAVGVEYSADVEVEFKLAFATEDDTR